MIYEMAARLCPKCGRDYSKDPFWSSKLKRHLARKNPCDKAPGEPYIKEKTTVADATFPEYNALDSVEWKRVYRPARMQNLRDVGPWFFKQIFSNPKNVCFVYPNVKVNQIVVRVSKDIPAEMLTTDEFIKEFVNKVFFKLFNFENEKRFSEWLSENLIYTEHMEWDGIFPDRGFAINAIGEKRKMEPEFMIEMRKTVKNFGSMQTDRSKLKQMLLA